MGNYSIVVCIPAYNEAKTIGTIVKQVMKYCTKVMVCDDGSVDHTDEIARSAGATVIKHNHNMGYGATIRSLFQAARKMNADIMVTIDSDGQHDVNDIHKLIEPIIRNNIDIVIGSRFLQKGNGRIPFYRSIGIKTITKFAQAITYDNLTDSQSGFRAYGRNALEKINLIENGMAVSTEILLRARDADLLVKEVPILISYDVENASTHNPMSHGLGIIASIVRFVSLRHPLAFYSLPGVILLVVSSGFLSFALELFSETRYVSTNSILISIGAAVIGVVLIATGIILYTMSALFKENMKDFQNK